MSPTLVVLQHQCVKGTGSMPATDRSRPEPPFSLSLCFLWPRSTIAFSTSPVSGQGVSQVVLVVKNLPANARDARDVGSIPGLGIYPGGGHGNPLQYSCLENPLYRGAWLAIVHRVTKSRTQLKQHTCKVTFAIPHILHYKTLNSKLWPFRPFTNVVPIYPPHLRSSHSFSSHVWSGHI